MDKHGRTLLAIATIALIADSSAINVRGDEPQFTPEQLEFFENRVRPLLAERCQKCHNSEDRKGNFVLDSRENLLKGGDTGPAVVPGENEAGSLIEAVRYGADGYQMPPDGKLADTDIATLEEWVRMGAPWPGGVAAAASAAPFDLERRAQHWSFQPLQHPSPPVVRNSEWPQTPVDRFLLHRLEAAGLSPARETDRATWIRRAYLDVIGLPPTPQEVAEFVGDPDPDAQAQIIERLLASPHYGERWGRHWLDLVRYAESRGHEFDYDVANPWHYRDYVIRALNDDLPYDRFVVEHVAGDLLPTTTNGTDTTRWAARRHPETAANESVVATGFWFLGEWVHSPVDIRQEEAERFANMIDVYSKTFLGLTVACARCHDHKFDPITQQDFYSLQSYLQSSVYRQALYETMDHNRDVAQRLEALRTEVTAALRPVLDEIAKPPAADVIPVSGEVKLPESAEVIVDYAQPGAALLAEGGVFGTRVVQPGEIRLSGDPQHPIAGIATVAAVERDPLWNGVGVAEGTADDPGRLEGWRRAGRTLRTPTFEITRKKLFVLISGGCNTYAVVDSHATINGPLHGGLIKEHPATDGWRWIEHDVARYIGHRAQLEIVLRGDEPLKVRQVVQADEPPTLIETPASDLDRLAAFIADPATTGPDADAARARLGELTAPYLARQQALLAEIRSQSAATPAMAESTSEEEYVFIRGNWKTPGESAPRRFLEVFHRPSSIDHRPSSTRLDLAAQMVDSDQTPILPRVIVNRIWQHYFGRGLAPSSDDFGHMGQPPSHPELLDWLANELVTHDWSLKHIHRLILLSAAYRMTSDAESGPADEVDPLNTLLHRMPLKRLEGEIVRDQLLALSGRLDSRLYGRSVPVHLTSFLEGRGKPKESGPVDGDGRRSLYIAVRRNFPEPFLQAFDFPNPHSSIGRRSVSNVPAQALALMNNPFVVQQAQTWAARVLSETPQARIHTRIAALYESAFARAPTEHELQAGEAFLARQSQEYNCSADDQTVWNDYCHVLINVKEFVFVR